MKIDMEETHELQDYLGEEENFREIFQNTLAEGHIYGLEIKELSSNFGTGIHINFKYNANSYRGETVTLTGIYSNCGVITASYIPFKNKPSLLAIFIRELEDLCYSMGFTVLMTTTLEGEEDEESEYDTLNNVLITNNFRVVNRFINRRSGNHNLIWVKDIG